MRLLFTAAALFLALMAQADARAEVIACSRAESDGTRTLCHEIVVPANAAEVWAVWTTSAGASSWLAPVAAVDLRPGGYLESSYDLTARIGDPGNIRNRITSFVPERMLAIEVEQAAFPMPTSCAICAR